MKYSFYKTIKGRFLIIVLALIIVLSVGISSYSYITFTQNLQNNILHSTETNLQFLADKINGNLGNIYDFGRWCQTNDDISDFILTAPRSPDYNKTTSDAKDKLDEEYFYNGSSAYIRRVVIASTVRRDFLQVVPANYSIDRPMADVVRALPFYAASMYEEAYNLKPGILKVPFVIYDLNMIPVIRPIIHPYRVETIGFVYLEISPSLFTDMLDSYMDQEDTFIYLTLHDHTYMIAGRQIIDVTDNYKIAAAEHKSTLNADTLLQTVETENGMHQAVCRPLNTSGCYITQFISPKIFHDQFKDYFLLMFFIILIVLAIGIILIFILSKTVSRPITKLKYRIDRIAKGDFSKDPSIEWDNEMGEIGRNINQLSEDIQLLMTERVESEKQKKDYEYQMLQSQINPHFLYNTLNSIKWMAVTQNAPGIGEMVTSLSRLLKSIAKGTSSIVTIENEFRLLDDYFTIQKYRYGGAILLDYDIEDEALKQNQILRFTLQPIVENAIFHGIEPTEKAGHIRIHLFKNIAGQVQIDITDNGVGMDEDTILRLLNEDSSEEKSKFFKDIGISSVNKRLQYTFGSAYGLSIKSAPGHYTTMSILLPDTAYERKE